MRASRLVAVAALALSLLTACGPHNPQNNQAAAPKPVAASPAVPTVCKGLGSKDLALCLELVRREATHQDLGGGASTDTPNGTTLAIECRDQYEGEELTSCLGQPA